MRAIEAHAGGASGMDAALRVAKVLLADRQPGAAVSFLLRLLEQKLVALEVRLSQCLSQCVSQCIYQLLNGRNTGIFSSSK